MTRRRSSNRPRPPRPESHLGRRGLEAFHLERLAPPTPSRKVRKLRNRTARANAARTRATAGSFLRKLLTHSPEEKVPAPPPPDRSEEIAPGITLGALLDLEAEVARDNAREVHWL